MNDVAVTPVATTDQAQLLRLTGNLDTTTAPGCARDLLESSAQLPPPSLILVDLRTLQTLSAGGIRVLVEFADANACRGIATCVLTEPDGPVRRALRLTQPSTGSRSMPHPRTRSRATVIFVPRLSPRPPSPTDRASTGTWSCPNNSRC